MSRETKFRGKRLDNNEWVYGYAIFGKDGHLAWIITEGYEATYGQNPDQNIFRVRTVGQYTGLKDKNGREIYEGDIIAIGPRRTTWQVSFNTDKAAYVGWSNIPSNFFVLTKSFLQTVKAEVIGNIYENPKLLGPKS